MNVRPDTVAKAIGRAEARRAEYIAAADNIANTPQVFDLLTIGAGLTGLAGAIFGGDADVMKGAALATTGLVVTRQYYEFDARHGVMVGASSALSCIQRKGETVIAVDPPAADAWEDALEWAVTADSDIAVAIRRLAPIALGAPRKIALATDDVETAVRRQLATPTAPDVSAFSTAYRGALETLQGAVAQNAAATAAESAGPQIESSTPTQEDLAAALLQDTALLNALSSLDVELGVCVSALR